MQNSDLRKLNLRMLLRVMGWLLMIEAAFMIAPIIAALVFHESDWLPFTATATATAIIGFSLHNIRPNHTSMGRREGFLLTASVWIIFSIFGMIPFIFCSTPQSVSTSFFEAMSGFTTTGASAFPSLPFSHAINFWRAMMQWIGGMGIILFTLAVLPMLNHSGGMQMFNAEVTGITHDKIQPRISQTAMTLWGVYTCLTVLCAVLLWIGPMDFYDSLCHAFGTLSTGGFTTSPLSIEAWHSVYTKIITVIFMTLGGINFAVIYRATTGDFVSLRTNEPLRLFLLLIAGYTILFILGSWLQCGATSAGQLTIDPLFRVVSTLTSTGYTIGSTAACGSFICTLMIPMMFFGACAGSTSGGAKLDRAIVLGKFVGNETRRALQPNNILAVKVGSTVISVSLVQKVLAFLILYIAIIFIGGIALSVLGIPFSDSLTASLSAMTNVGYSPNTLGLSVTMQSIPTAGLWILAALMMIGRLEIFTLLVLFLPKFWRK